MLIDKIKIKVSGGKGGDGIVAFSKEKMRLGPTGGNGGSGGDVIAEGVSDIGALRQFRYKKEFRADNGKIGGGSCRAGHSGKDIILKIPVGTVIFNLTTGSSQEVIKIGERVVLAEGGKGGRGNFSFRSSINTSPEEFTEGIPGIEAEIEFELKLIADVGLIGLPNAGKSSLLNILTGAKSRVANYHFTTLEPHLGAYNGLILADIPGLISGASRGKGLGIKFLRHIERTKILFHLISSESDDFLKDYELIREELDLYGKGLTSKPEFVMITKSDLSDKKELEKKMFNIKEKFPESFAVSIIDDDSLLKIRNILDRILREKSENESKA